MPEQLSAFELLQKMKNTNGDSSKNKDLITDGKFRSEAEKNAVQESQATERKEILKVSEKAPSSQKRSFEEKDESSEAKKLKEDKEGDEIENEINITKQKLNSKKNKKVKNNKKQKTVTNKPSNSVTKFPSFPEPTGDSIADGQAAFEWLIHPTPLKVFNSKYWEKNYLINRRDNKSFVNKIFSMKDFDRILKQGKMQFTVNLDVTSYKNGKRKTHNPNGKANPSVAWGLYKGGCSLRIKNPQTFSPPILKICSTMQEHFKSMVGANIYLTPAGTQGFAPHYDDIEAFVLQLEGKKEWRVYRPRSEQETLPKYSSENFEQDEIGEMVWSGVLQPGDILYFPRGFIHQARSLPDAHSLHITISTYQCQTYHDLFKNLLDQALQTAVEEDVEFRRGLPIDFLDCFGAQNSENDSQRRRALMGKIGEMFTRLYKHADVDAAADQRAVSFIHDSLPPVLTKDEKCCMVHGTEVAFNKKGQPTRTSVDIQFDTKVRLVRKNALRIVSEGEEGPPTAAAASSSGNQEDDDDVVRVYYNTENPTVYHAEEKKYLLVNLSRVAGVDALLHAYPNYIQVDDFPIEDETDKLVLAYELFEHGLIMSEKPLGLSDSVEIAVD